MVEKITREKIIECFRVTHGDFYDYSLVEYSNIHGKVKIVCPKHGVFEQSANSHKKGNGCPKCAKREVSQVDMLNRFKNIHGENYDYSKSIYVNQKTEICVICPKHGEFYQLPSIHWSGCGCPKCKNRGLSLEEVIVMFKKVHEDKYDYSKFIFKNMRTKAIIICNEHGEFLQSPSQHASGRGCLKCSQGMPTNEEVINRFKSVHGDFYDYSKVKYEHTQKKVCIICPKHGEFFTTPNIHYKGHKCPSCKREEQSLNKSTPNGNSIRDIRPDLVKYLKNESDADKYCYSSNTKITCKCKDCGGEKEISPSDLNLYGIMCNFCTDSRSTPEKFGTSIFKQSKLKFEMQKRFEWSGRKRYDFYLNDLDILIEVHGMQHYKQSTRSKKLEHEIENDKFKKDLANKNGISGYITIDCRYSNFDFLKENFIKELSSIVDFSLIDWDLVLEHLNYNYVHDIWQQWNSRLEYELMKDVAKKVGVSYSTCMKYIKLGVQLSKVHYDKKEEKQREMKYRSFRKQLNKL